jgi:hypothetical protein
MVLIVTLILLFVVTLLAVAAMRAATFDRRIAAAQQHRDLAFQAAENALAQLLAADPSMAPPAATGSEPVTESGYFRKLPAPGVPGVSADLTIGYRGRMDRVLVSGFALDATGLVYEAEASGTVDDTGSAVTNRMGVVLIR